MFSEYDCVALISMVSTIHAQMEWIHNIFLANDTVNDRKE